jgi:hypothetical protein
MGTAAAAPSPSPEKGASSQRKPTRKPEVTPIAFISHSSHDKPFARQLINELEKDRAPVKLWIDEQGIDPGASIVGNINETLDKSDYLLLIHSKHSAESNWVKREVEAATSIQISGGGIVVITAVLDNTPLTALLRDRLWIDFRADYKKGYGTLLTFFREESASVIPPQELVGPHGFGGDDCPTRLGRLPQRQLRIRMQKGLNRDEVGVVWFDVLAERMDDFMPQKAIDACLVELLDRCNRRRKTSDLLSVLCDNWSHVASG